MSTFKGTSLVERIVSCSPFHVEQNIHDDSTQALIHSIKDHLEKLLNTKKRCISWEKKYKHLAHSILNYGILDFKGLMIDNISACEDYCHEIQKAIIHFEPRLSKVKVALYDKVIINRALKFTISALLSHVVSNKPVIFICHANTRDRSFVINLDIQHHAR